MCSLVDSGRAVLIQRVLQLPQNLRRQAMHRPPCYVVSARGELDATNALRDVNGDGVINIADAETLGPSTLIADAHAVGLLT